MESMTIKDIAKKCGVGVSTVSRAINNHPDINKATKEMIMQVIKDYNYIPNNSARNLKRAESRTIAILIKGISNPFFQDMIKVFEEEIQKNRYNFLLQSVDSQEDEVELAMELIKEKRLKGIIFLGGFLHHSQEKLQQLTVPFVLSTISTAGNVDTNVYSSVNVDDVKESKKLVEYLCSLGHKDIALLTADKDDLSIGKLRLEGYLEALKEKGIEAKSELIRYTPSNSVENCYTMENGYTLTKDLLESGVDFSAIYAVSDSIAIGACKALFEAGKRVPEDYSVAGFDGLEIAYYYNPSITTIKQPVVEMAHETTRILFDRIKNKKANQHRIFDGELIIRESTAEI